MTKDNMQKEQSQPPVIRQITGAVLGVAFAVTGGYSGLEFVFALLFSPILIAGVVRLVIGLYRVFGKLTAQKVYNELGQCVMLVPRTGVAAALAIVGLGCVISVLVSAFQFATFAGVAVTCVLMVLEIYIFLKDLKHFRKTTT